MAGFVERRHILQLKGGSQGSLKKKYTILNEGILPWQWNSIYCSVSPFSFTFPDFDLNFRDDENIQKRDCPFLGPSPRNSCPKPLPHFPHDTFNALGPSGLFDTLSLCTVSVNAGQGELCWNFFLLEKSS